MSLAIVFISVEEWRYTYKSLLHIYISYNGKLSETKEFHIRIEDFIYQSTSFIQALSVLVAAIYSFNIQYTKEIFGTWVFIQKYLLGIDDGIKTPKRLARLLSSLN